MYEINDLPESIATRLKEDEKGCWLWQGRLLPHGYGAFQYQGLSTTAHRIVYIQLVGEIPKGLEMDHLCRVRNCCNPSHLEPVTHHTNVIRGVAAEVTKARHKERTHCKRGHPLSGDNVYLYDGKYPTRICRTCGRERSKLFQRQVRQEKKLAQQQAQQQAQQPEQKQGG